MYNVRKVLTLDSSPLIRLEKRLASLKHTHNAGLARSAFLTENNLNVNRQLMESLILRLHSVDSKSKKNKRVANRMKIGSPKRVRSVGGKPQEMFNANFSGYSGFHSKFHGVKRMLPSEFCDSSDSTFLKDLKELPPLHPSEVETVLRKKDAGSRSVSQKVEPIFPPPPDPSCTVTPRTSAPTLNKPCSAGAQRLRKGPQSFSQAEHSSSKYSTPTTSCIANFGSHTRQNTLPVPSTHNEPYPYVDFQSKYDPNCYPSMSSGYDQFTLPRFPNEYGNFNSYARSPSYSTWASLGKYDQTVPGRISQNSIASSLSGMPNYGNYLTTNAPGNPTGFTTNLPFNSSFQNENFIQNMQSYASSMDSQHPGYGMNLSTYNYPQPPVPPSTTSYL